MDHPSGSWQVDLTVNQTVMRYMKLIEDRNKTLGEVIDMIADETDKEKDHIYTECKQFFEMVKKTNIVLLKGQNVPDFLKTYRRPLFGLSFL